MAGISTRLDRAAATHREAVALAAAAGSTLDRYGPTRRGATDERSIRELAERLRVAAAQLAPGWLGAPLDAAPASTPLGAAARPDLVRIGTAYPLDDASFPAIVPLGHLAFDADARDPRVAGALKAVLLRLLASVQVGTLLVRPIDAAGVVFPTRATTAPPASEPGGPFAALHDAGIMPPPVTDRAGLLAVLAEAEQWVRAGGARVARTLLLVVASWPQSTEPADLARLAALAASGPAARVHLLVGGWPPPPLTTGPDEPALPDGTTGPEFPAAIGQPLPHTTQVMLQNPYVLVGDPPGGSFASPVPPDQPASSGLPAPTYLDEAPSADLITRVCAELASQAIDQARLTLGELLPNGPLWTADASDGLTAVIGRAGSAPVSLRLADTTPHWLIVGRPGSGRTALLLDILYGLCSRYDPRQLSVYLLDHSGNQSFASFIPQASDPSHLPHARAVTLNPSRPDALAVLGALTRQVPRRAANGTRLPRLICLVDELAPLLAGDDPIAAAATELLLTLARQGGPVGIHLVLASRTMPPAPIASQCRVRIALPGGTAALDAANDAAAALALGTAVVNTASGLGGPRGATRAHEQLVRFPDPHTDQVALAGLRHRLWRAASEPLLGDQP